MNLREVIERRRREGTLRIVSEEIDPRLEIAALLSRLEGRSVLFEKVRRSAIPVAGNLVSGRALLADALGTVPDDLIGRLIAAQKEPVDAPVVREGACQEEVVEPADAGRLPVLRHLPSDGGPYMTSSIVVVRDPKLGLNLSYHRLMLLSPDTASIRIVEQRGLDRAVQRAGGEVDVAILLGAPPQVMVAAATSPPDDVDEYRIAQALADTPLVPGRTVDVPVPAETEIVVEGRITSERADEGPFIDLTQTLDYVRQQPVVKLHCITMRRDAIYHALLPGQGDHATLMGLPREADIFREVGRACECIDVAMRPGGCCWLHAVVQIRKRSGDDPRRAIDAALKAHPSLKLIVVVDEDVNPHNDQIVEWALATRFQADRGVVIYENRPSSSLDPSATHVPGKKAIGAKLGIDATAVELSDAFRRTEYPPLPPERFRRLLGED